MKRAAELAGAVLRTVDPEWVAEHPFAASIGRKWRFDYACLRRRLAVEINGNAWATRGGGRHGGPKDLEKMNAAQAMGWCVLQYGTSKTELSRMESELRHIFGMQVPHPWEKNKKSARQKMANILESSRG